MENINNYLDKGSWASSALSNTWLSIDKSQRFRKDLLDVFQIGDYFHVIFNLADANFEFCGGGVGKVLGYEPSDFSRHQLLENIHPQDLSQFLNHEYKAAKFYASLPAGESTKYKVHYDFRVQNKYGIYKRLMKRIVKCDLDTAGIPLRTLSIFSDISYLKKDANCRFSIRGRKSITSTNIISDKSEIKPENLFSARELEVLKLLCSGKTVRQISTTLHLSESTINNHRYNMLLKAGVKSSPGLLGKAMRNGWIE